MTQEKSQSSPLGLRVLVLYAHPAHFKSVINRQLIHAYEKIDQLIFHDLYEFYPDFYIDVEYEQKLLMAHDLIIFHHPFYWYSAPALLKHWMDLVLTYGFAYGEKGEALKDKYLLTVTSTGGSRKAYCDKTNNHFDMNQLLAPFHQSALLCSMNYLPPFVIHDAHRLKINGGVPHYTQRLHQVIKGLQQAKVNPAEVANFDYIDDDMTLFNHHIGSDQSERLLIKKAYEDKANGE